MTFHGKFVVLVLKALHVTEHCRVLRLQRVRFNGRSGKKKRRRSVTYDVRSRITDYRHVPRTESSSSVSPSSVLAASASPSAPLSPRIPAENPAGIPKRRILSRVKAEHTSHHITSPPSPEKKKKRLHTKPALGAL